MALAQDAAKPKPKADKGRPGEVRRVQQRDKMRAWKRYMRLVRPGRINVVDRARYTIASILIKEEKHGEAIEELQRVAAKSPDPEVVSATHLNVGNIYLQLMNDPESALEHYEKVKGRLALEAMAGMVKACEAVGDAPRAADLLEKAAAEAKEPTKKAEILSGLAEFYQRHDQNDKAVAALRKITELVPYDQAQRLLDETARHRDYRAKAQMKIQGKIDHLKKAGRLEEAAKLEKGLIDRKAKKRTQDQNRAHPKKKKGPAAKIDHPKAEKAK